MFYNIICYFIHIFGAKVQNYFDMTKFICFFLQKSSFSCIIQKKVVTLQRFLKNECILWQNYSL